ncbi:hypothetical protein ABZ891_18420 [Streptomyces sp. NPDC047023]|uniref:hypothetical protein n=1 Tax=Streptomyces sp. NPDC047023 TaxID=3155139 RepID=UPI0033E73E50
MLDGLQIAVVAALTSGDTGQAAELIAETVAGAPWEHAVTRCLDALCLRASADLSPAHEHELGAAIFAVPIEQGMTVFDTRLGLAALGIIGSASPAARRLADHLHRRIGHEHDGFAAREVLTDPMFTEQATPAQLTDCSSLVDVCALGAGVIPGPLRRDFDAALQSSDRVIRNSLATS